MEIQATLPEKGRDLRLDFFRGIANWWIFLDHIPNNVINWVTPRNYGFSDAADLFVFISGYTCMIAYGGVLQSQGWLAMSLHAVSKHLKVLERAGLSVGGVTRAPNDQVGEGLIAGSDPPAESVLPRGTPVALLMSTGTGGERFVMPDLTGREIGGVRRQLEALGFRVMTPPAAPTVGPILAQSPPPGSQLTRDMQIVLQATGRIIR